MCASIYVYIYRYNRNMQLPARFGSCCAGRPVISGQRVLAPIAGIADSGIRHEVFRV